MRAIHIYIFIHLSGVFSHGQDFVARTNGTDVHLSRVFACLLAGSFNRSLNRDNCRMNCDKHNTSLKLLINSKPLTVTRSQPAILISIWYWVKDREFVFIPRIFAFVECESIRALFQQNCFFFLLACRSLEKSYPQLYRASVTSTKFQSI